MKTRIGVSIAAALAVAGVGGIAAAQDPVGIVTHAWEIGGPIAATVAIMLLASGFAIRTLWNQLQAERRDFKAAIEQQNKDTVTALEKRNTDSMAWTRELRDCINATTAALNRVTDQREAELEERREIEREQRRHRS